MRKAKKKNEHYVSNPDFFKAICAYQESVRLAEEAGKDKPRVTPYIGDCIMRIANRLAHRPNFSGYSYRDDMVADAIENCVSYGVEKFNPNRTQNPFAYFTQISWNAFRLRIQKEKKQSYIKYKQMENMYTSGEWADTQDGDDLPGLSSGGGKGGSASNSSFMVHVGEFVKQFETSQEQKKVKKRQAGLDKLLGNEDAK